MYCHDTHHASCGPLLPPAGLTECSMSQWSAWDGCAPPPAATGCFAVAPSHQRHRVVIGVPVGAHPSACPATDESQLCAGAVVCAPTPPPVTPAAGESGSASGSILLVVLISAAAAVAVAAAAALVYCVACRGSRKARMVTGAPLQA